MDVERQGGREGRLAYGKSVPFHLRVELTLDQVAKLEGLAAAQKENELEDFDRGPDEALT